MELNKDFYLFEILDNYKDKLLCFEDGDFYKGEKFIGWENRDFKNAIKSNKEEIVCIPLNKVKKLYKIEFKEI